MFKPYTTTEEIKTKHKAVFKELFKGLDGVKVTFVKDRLYPEYSKATIQMPTMDLTVEENLSKASKYKKRFEEIKIFYRHNISLNS